MYLHKIFSHIQPECVHSYTIIANFHHDIQFLIYLFNHSSNQITLSFWSSRLKSTQFIFHICTWVINFSKI